MPTPDWVTAARECVIEGDMLKEQIADRRARIIADAVAAYGRGGRDKAAAELGVTVAVVDRAIKRAANSLAHNGLPYDLLDRLYALELAEMPPLPAHLWQALAQTLMGTFVDATWVEQPGQLIAMDVEDCAEADELDPDDAQQLADACRSWTRIQALAVIDAIQSDAIDSLPTSDDDR